MLKFLADARVGYTVKELSTEMTASVETIWLEHSFGVFRSNTGQLQTIRIHFTRDVARYVKESNWHNSQKLTPQKDGSLLAEFELTDTQEIKRWIMSFGPNAKVIGPDSMVEEVSRDLQRMLSSYAATREQQT